MKVIINDFSLDGQFSDIDEFLDSLYDSTLPMLKRLEPLKIKIVRSYYSYESKVTRDKSLNELLISRGNPEITKLKGQIQKLLFEEPYWEDDIKSINKIYECDYTKQKNSFCLAEALEREIPVLSFEHEGFKESSIEIKRDGISKCIKNLYNYEILLDIFREEKKITHLEYLCLKHSLTESFGLEEDKNYFDELVKSASLSGEDENYIVTEMERLIVFTKMGKNPGDLSKSIEGKLKEFRTSLTNNRQIRIFYFEKNRKLIFLNGFLKKLKRHHY